MSSNSNIENSVKKLPRSDAIRVGRRTEYYPQAVDIAYRIMAYFSGNIGPIAAVLGVSRQTIYRWQRQHPEFKQAIQEGRDACN